MASKPLAPSLPLTAFTTLAPSSIPPHSPLETMPRDVVDTAIGLEELSNEFQRTEPPAGRSLRHALSPISTRIKMVVLFTLGIVAMVAHDLYYSSLEQNTIIAIPGFGLSSDDVQKSTSVIGNLFAILANLVLSAATGLVFVQVFWIRMRSRGYTIAQIDSAMSSATNAFGIAAWRAWRSMFFLTLIPALGIANSQIVLLSSGAIRVQLSAAPGSCLMKNVNLANARFAVVGDSSDVNGATAQVYTRPEAQVKGYVTQVVMFNESLAPEVINKAVQTYNLQFDAPGLKCTDISSSVDPSTFLPSSPPGAPIVIWNTNYALGAAGTVLNFTTATRDLEGAGDNQTFLPVNNGQTVQCVFYNVTYDVAINRTEFGDFTSAVMNRTLNAPLSVGSTSTGLVTEELNFDALADMFGRTLNGTAAYDPNTFDFTPNSPIIVYSQFGEAVGGVPWSLGGVDRSVAIQNLMDVVSVSLLSNIVNADTSTSPLSRIQGDCSVQVLAFSYDRFRLLLSYGLGLLYTAICIAIGFYAIRVNGFEETLDFSRILKSVVHPGLFEHKDNLQYHQTRLHAHRGEAGEFHIAKMQ